MRHVCIDEFTKEIKRIVEDSIITSNGRTPIKYKLSEKGINTLQELN